MKKLIFAFWAAVMGFNASAQIIDIKAQTLQVRQSEEFIAFEQYQKAHAEPDSAKISLSGLNCEQYTHRWTLRWDSPRNFQVWEKDGGANSCLWLQADLKPQNELHDDSYGLLIQPIGDRYILVRRMLIASRFENIDHIYERR